MSQDNVRLSRRKILAGLGTVGAAGAGAGLGTSAFFSDEETFEGNTITAGTLDLKVDWAEQYFDGVRNLADDCDATVRYLDDGESPNDDEVGFPTIGDPLVAVPETEAPSFRNCITTDSFAGQGDAPPSGVVELQDVKPGDFGEISLCYGISDNPGYVGLDAAVTLDDESSVTDPESAADGEDQSSDDPDDDADGELGETIQAAAWYDPDGNARVDDGLDSPMLLAQGSLNDVLDATATMDPASAGGSPGWDTGDGCHVPGIDCVETLFLADSGDGSSAFDGETRLYEVDLREDPDVAELTHLTTLPTDNFAQTDAIAATPEVPGHPESPIGEASGNAIFVVDKDTCHLGRYDLGADTFEDLGPVDGLDPSDQIVLLSFDPQGQLWVLGQANGNRICRIDDFESSPTAVATASVDGAEVEGADIAYDSNGTLYLYSNADETLYTIDRSTGQASAVGSSSDDTGYMTGLAIQSAGTGDLVSSSEDDDAIVVLDKQDGSEVTQHEMRLDGDAYSYGFGDMTVNQLCPEYCIALEWWLPVDTGNEVQSDRLEFDLTLRTEQCRNNEQPFDG